MYNLVYLTKILIFKTIDFYSFLIIVAIIGSWIDPMKESKIFQYVEKVTSPYLNLFKVVVPVGNINIDFSAVIGLIILSSLKRLIFNII